MGLERICFLSSVEAAVRAFAQVRPPGIYKEDYLQELFRRYDDPDNTPPAPPLPEWCTGKNPLAVILNIKACSHVPTQTQIPIFGPILFCIGE